MSRKLLASTAVALVVGSLGLVAADVVAVHAGKTALAGALARGGITFASIDIAPLSGRAVARGLAFTAGNTRIEIGALRLPIPRFGFGLVPPASADESSGDFGASPAPGESSPPPPGGSPPPPAAADDAAGPAASTATADDVIIMRGQATIRIKHIEMAGSSLSSGDLAKLLDAETAESLESRLRKVSATAIVIPEIVSDDMTPGSERHTTTKQVLLANVTAGKAAAASAAGTTFSVKSGDDTIDGTIGSMEGANVDLAQAAHVAGTVRADDNEPIVPLFDKVVVSTIKVTNEAHKGSFTVGSIVETGVKARPFKTDLATASATATSGSPADARSAALFDDLAHSFVIGGLEIDDLAFHDEAAAGSTRFDVARAGMQGFADRRVGGLSMRGFHLDAPDAKLGIGTLDIGAFVIPQPKEAVAAGLPQVMAPPGKMDIGQIDVEVPARNTGATAPIKVQIGHVGFISDGEPAEIPGKASFAIDNFGFDVPIEAAAGMEALVALGYKHIDMSSKVTTTYDAANQDLKIDRFTLNGVDMGTASLGLHLVNVTKGLVSSNPQVQQASALAILAKGLDLQVKNGGLFEKAIAFRAQHDGMTVAQERELGVDFFANKLPASLNDQPGVKAIGAAIAKFIADPRTLHIAIESKSGLGVGAMGMLNDPSVLLDTLDIKASADD